MKKFYGDLRVGILGGGQLGRMWIQNAMNYNVNVAVMDADANAPCKNFTERFVNADITDYQAVYDFGKTVDLLTIEIEKVNIEALEQLEKEGVLVFPQPHILKMIRDKGVQKQWLHDHHIPTSAFKLCDSIAEMEQLKWSFPYVQKSRKDGYDGKGVNIIRTQADISTAFEKDFLVERMVSYEKEISVIVARNENGEVKTFPVVEMEFHPTANLVEFLVSPADISAFHQLKAENIALKIAEELELVGILAVEMFLTKEGEILVNEMAPRPHNSGHQSIEGNRCSQYEQHLRAIFNQPLGDTEAICTSVMVNILGDEGFTGEAKYVGLEEVLSIPGVYVHLYGKKITKPFRKMGHLTITHIDRETAISNARKVKEILKVQS